MLQRCSSLQITLSRYTRAGLFGTDPSRKHIILVFLFFHENEVRKMIIPTEIMSHFTQPSWKDITLAVCFCKKNRNMFQFVSVSGCVILTFLQNASYHAHMTCLWPNFHSSGGDGGRLWLKFHHLWVWQGGRDNSCHVYGDIRGCDLRRFSLTPTKMFWCLNLTKTQAQCGHMIQLNLT